MRFIEPPHIILRKSLIQNQRVTSFAAEIGTFMAQTLFGTSALALEGGSFRQQVTLWSQNIGLCALTEKVIFTDPYTVCEMNHWTPQLEAYAVGIREDAALKLAAAYHKSIFLTSTQALLHGDLHTGSVMVAEGSTFVIDPEFAFYGPMGFDVGAILSNLFLAYFSKSAVGSEEAAEYSEWILAQVALLHETFVRTFRSLWTAAAASEGFTGEVFRKEIYQAELLQEAQCAFLAGVWRDTVGFTGMKMIRRIVGIAHVEDLQAIVDDETRALCEKRALLFARQLVLASHANNVPDSVEAVLGLARSAYSATPSAEWPR